GRFGATMPQRLNVLTGSSNWVASGPRRVAGSPVSPIRSRVPEESTHMSLIPTVNDERGRYTRGYFAAVLCLMIVTSTWQGAGSVYAWANNEGLGVIESLVQQP